MNTIKYLRGALLATAISVSAPALAQTVPGGSVNQSVASSPASASGYRGSGNFQQFTPPGGTPRAARPSTIGRDTPVMTKEEFLRRYPNSGEAGYQLIRRSTEDLCGEVGAIMSEIADLRAQFGDSNAEYVELSELYRALTKKMKRRAALMTIAQAGSTGALCALTAGLYCIAAAVSGGGNIVGIHGNLKMQLLHIKLSKANIRLTRINIRSNLLTLRADDLWVRMAAPVCAASYPDARAPW